MTREMKDSGIEWIGQIPKEWNLQRIKFTLKQRIENNSPIKSKNILSLTAKQGVIPIGEKEGGGNKPKEDLSSYRLAYPDDIVMNSMNILSGSVGLSKYFGCVSPVYYMFNIEEQYGDIRYYNYIFQTKVFQKSLFGLGNGILIKESENGNLNTIRMRIPAEKFGNLLIPVPSVSTQRLISNFLDSKCSQIDSILTSLQDQIDILEQYKKSVITEAVTKGLNPDVEMKDSGVEWIGMTPNHWVVTKVKYSCKTRENNNWSYKDENLDYFSLENIDSWNYRYMQTSNVYDLLGSKLCYKNDVVFGKLRPYLAKTFLVDYNRCCSSEFAIFYDFKGLQKYLLFLVTSKGFVDTVDFSTYGTKMPRANIEFIKDMLIAIPPAEEQQQIVDFLDAKCSQIDSIISQKKEQIETLKEYKKSLIYEYVTGKKEVPNA